MIGGPDAARIRDGVLDEIPALEALQRRASTVSEDYRDQLAAHPDAIELPAGFLSDGLVRVAVDDSGARLGFAVSFAVVGGASELDGLFVEPDRWRRGVGRALVDDVVDRARRAGADRLEVIANPGAVGFYQRVGFEDAGTATTRFGPAPCMVLRFAEPPRPA